MSCVRCVPFLLRLRSFDFHLFFGFPFAPVSVSRDAQKNGPNDKSPLDAATDLTVVINITSVSRCVLFRGQSSECERAPLFPRGGLTEKRDDEVDQFVLALVLALGALWIHMAGR